MERFILDVEAESVVEHDARASRSSSKKRKWREIEALKDKFRLQRELQSIDVAYNRALAEMDF